MHNADMNPTVLTLAKLREHGLSQSEISRRTGISQSKLSRWERGDVPLALLDAIKLDELLKSSDTNPTTQPDHLAEAAQGAAHV